MASRLDWRTRRHSSNDPAPALLPRPVAALLRCDRRRADDRGRESCCSTCSTRGTTRKFDSTLVKAQTVAQNLSRRSATGAMAAARDAAERRRTGVGDQERRQGRRSSGGWTCSRGRSGRSGSICVVDGLGHVRRSGSPVAIASSAGAAAGLRARSRSGGSRLGHVGAGLRRGGRSELTRGRRARGSRRRRCSPRRRGGRHRADAGRRPATTSRSAAREYRTYELPAARAGRGARPTVRLFTPVPADRATRRSSS